MPPPRFLCLSLGSVVKFSATGSVLTIAATVADIIGLHPYFAKPSLIAATNADEIYGYKAAITPGTTVGDIVFTNRSIGIPAGCVICELGVATSATPTKHTAPLSMAPNCCYWLVASKKKKPHHSGGKTKTKKRTAKKRTAKKRR